MKTKNLLKSLISLSLLTVICACSSESKVKAYPTDADKLIGNTEMSTIYSTLYDELGSSAAFDKVLLEIAKIEVKDSRNEELYERINEKMENLMESTTYTDYTDYTLDVDGEVVGDFNEEKLVKYLRSEGYTVNNETAANCWDAETVLTELAKGNVINTYISDYYYPMVMKEMLNEEYIVAEQASKLKNARYREIEFVYIDFDKENPNETLNRVYAFEEKIKTATAEVNLKELADDWKDYQKDQLDYKAANINNPEVDKNKDFASTFTCSFTKDVETCLKSLKLSIDQTEYYSENEFYSSSESTILNSTMRDEIFSSKIFEKTGEGENETYKNVYKAPYKDKNNEDIFYLKKGENIFHFDSSNNRYYFVRIKDVAKATVDSSNEAYNPELGYEAAKILRTTSSTTTASIVHFLEKYEVEFFDEDLYDYVQDTYNYPED